MIKTGLFFAVLTLVLASTASADAPETGRRDYLGYVTRFADTLLDKGRDTYGPRKTPLWAAVIDTRTLTVPSKDVPSPEGVRPGDRAVGGSNLYHDVATLHTLRALSAVTGDTRYEGAVRDYVKAFLENAQSEQTGLLAWGEHTYYDLFADKGAVAPEYSSRQYGNLWHELLGATPPWEMLWAADPERTERAIRGLRYHFFAPDGGDFLFNRHAYWHQAVYQKPQGSQPWIKHSGLYAHAFLFLHGRRKDAESLRWARGIGALYWNHRNSQTDLTLGCIGDPRPMTQRASLGGTSSLAYWLLKGCHADPARTEFRDRALTLLKAYDRYGYDTAKGVYRGSVNRDGTDPSAPSPVWQSGYGEANVLKFGRIAAYAARTENDAACREMAVRVAREARATPLPPKFVCESVAFALNLSLDLYDLTGEKAYLDDARRYADVGVDKFWTGGLFARQTDDPYYEAKLGTGELVAGLLRLHLRLHPEVKDPGLYDWSF